MENLKVYIGEQKKEYTQLLIKVHDDILSAIKQYTKCPSDRLSNYLTQNGEVIFNMGTLEENEFNELIKTIENIANNMETKDLFMKLLTNNGKDMMPANMHKIMSEEYGLTDEIEWFTSLIFISIGGLITQPEFCYRSIEEDIESGDYDIMITS